jgi:hypothetical protein
MAAVFDGEFVCLRNLDTALWDNIIISVEKMKLKSHLKL